MSSTGIMGDSGEFRTNPSSGHDGDQGGGGAFSKIGSIVGKAMDRRRQESQAQFSTAANLVNEREHRTHAAQESQRGRIFDATEAAANREHQLNVMKLQHKQANQLIGSGKIEGRLNLTQGDHSVQATIAKPKPAPRASKSTMAKPAASKSAPLTPAQKSAQTRAANKAAAARANMTPAQKSAQTRAANRAAAGKK